MTIREQIREIIEPRNESIYSRLYDWTMLSAIVIGILPLMFRGHHKVFFYFDLFSGLCFIIDYLLRWITADVRYKHNRVLAFLIYPFTPMAIIDLLSILPTFNMLSPTFKVARVSRLLRDTFLLANLQYAQSHLQGGPCVAPAPLASRHQDYSLL